MQTRFRVLTLVLLAAAIIVPAARGDGGPSPGVSLDRTGITDPARGLAYSTEVEGKVTSLLVRDQSGGIVRTRVLDRIYGVPFVTYNGTKGGLSRDGRTLVLAQSQQGAGLAATSRLIVLDTRTLRTRSTIDLRGDFSFDALSPDARTLFLIQHTSAGDYERYRVRAYNLAQGRLLPNAIVDKTEPNMRGQPLVRLVGPGGAWVYTLYAHQGGEPFVHALDTVHASARCLDVDWDGNQNLLWSARLKLGDRKLNVLTKAGKRIAVLELQPQRASGLGAGWLSGIAAMALAGAALVLWLLCGRGRLTLRRLAIHSPWSSTRPNGARTPTRSGSG
jgi:hypothetical protein